MKVKKTGSQEIMQEIARMIRNGELQHNQRLPAERELAERFNVSRGTIRKSLSLMSDEGLIEVRRGAGAFVIWEVDVARGSMVRQAKPLELMDARFAFEPHICRLATLNATEPDLLVLRELTEEMDVSLDEPSRFAQCDTLFHRRLVIATGNELLGTFGDQIENIRKGSEWTRMRTLTLSQNIMATYNQQHKTIFEAIAAGLAEEAANAMKEHLHEARNALVNVYDI